MWEPKRKFKLQSQTTYIYISNTYLGWRFFSGTTKLAYFYFCQAVWLKIQGEKELLQKILLLKYLCLDFYWRKVVWIFKRKVEGRLSGLIFFTETKKWQLQLPVWQLHPITVYQGLGKHTEWSNTVVFQLDYTWKLPGQQKYFKTALWCSQNKVLIKNHCL